MKQNHQALPDREILGTALTDITAQLPRFRNLPTARINEQLQEILAHVQQNDANLNHFQARTEQRFDRIDQRLIAMKEEICAVRLLQ